MSKDIAYNLPLQFSDKTPYACYLLHALACGKWKREEFVYFRGKLADGTKNCASRIPGQKPLARNLLEQIRDTAVALEKAGKLRLEIRRGGRMFDGDREYVAHRVPKAPKKAVLPKTLVAA